MAPASPPSFFSIVLNHNGCRWLPRCLASLLACDYPAQRVVLVDNGSADDSIALARSISDRIEILALGANLGFSEGNNAGIDYALSRDADYVALLNNDTYFEPDWITRLVEVGETQPAIGVLGPVHLVFDGE
jgi:GT2 family glycosyltransferase